jgi:hypothetical protein
LCKIIYYLGDCQKTKSTAIKNLVRAGVASVAWRVKQSCQWQVCSQQPRVATNETKFVICEWTSTALVKQKFPKIQSKKYRKINLKNIICWCGFSGVVRKAKLPLASL